MGIRVLRLIEYIYDSEESAAADMARWVYCRKMPHMTMRSAVMPLEAVEWFGTEENNENKD